MFYIPGYDPFPPRRYRELYRREAGVQAAICGYRLTVSAPGGGNGWQVAAEIEGAGALTDLEVLVWSDLVRGSMRNGIVATYLQMLRTLWIYLRSGAIWRLARLRKGPTIAALYPVLLLLLQAAVAAGLAVAAGWGAARAIAPAGPAVKLAGAVAAAAVLWWAAMQVFRRLDARLYAWYLMNDYAYGAQADGDYPPDLAARLGLWRQRIAAALDGSVDEVLVVGHSTGAHLAVSVLAGLPPHGAGPALGLLTLGQVAPMITFLPKAGRLRADLRAVSLRDDIAWVDVSAPGDGCAYALCDPVAVSGVAPPGQRGPLVLSAAFTQTLSPDRWRRLRWRWFRLHFQYLCAFDRPGAYDYFRITAGPRTLADRFAPVPPSPGVIRRALNPHRGLA